MTWHLSTEAKLDLLLDVARANDLHQEACPVNQAARAWKRGRLLSAGSCDCWLSQPAPPPALVETDLIISIYRSGSELPGGASAHVRIVHAPTGHTVTEAHQSAIQAKAAALEKLARIVADG